MPFLGIQPSRGLVGTAGIDADAVTGAKIADDQIDSEHLVAGGVDLEHMSSQSVDEDNLHISNAGSNGQFLSKQSGNAGGMTWASAGGGSVTFIASVAASDSATVAFESGIDSTYDEYIIKGVNLHSASDDVNLTATLGTRGPSYLGGSNYTWAVWGQNEGGTSTADGGSDTSSIGFNKDSGSGERLGNGTGETMDIDIVLRAPSATDNWKKLWWHNSWTGAASGQSSNNCVGGAQVQDTSALVAIKFAFSSGNITSGTFYLYGVNKS